MRYVLITLFMIGCTPDKEDIPCDLQSSDQTGIYHMTTSEVSGDCGSMGNLEVTIDSGVVLLDDGVGCSLESSFWNSDNCATESYFSCDDGTWVKHLEWSVVSDPSDLDKLSGTLSADMDKWSGIYTCTSEYTFEAERVEEIE